MYMYKESGCTSGYSI